MDEENTFRDSILKISGFYNCGGALSRVEGGEAIPRERGEIVALESVPSQVEVLVMTGSVVADGFTEFALSKLNVFAMTRTGKACRKLRRIHHLNTVSKWSH